MSVLPVINQIIMLFIIAMLGLMLRKIGVFTDPVIKGINSTVIYVAWPAMMLMTTQKQYTPEVLSDFATVLIASVVILTVTALILFAVFARLKDERLRPVLTMMAVMPNAGYIGLPIVSAVYGDAGALYLAAYIAGFNIVLWTVGVALFTGFRRGMLKGMLNPGFISVIVGVTLFVLKIQLPPPLLSTVTQLGGLNTPLAMLLLGSRMDTLRLPQLADGRLWLTTLIRLLIVPIASFFICRAMGITGLTLGVITLATAMPAASAGQMLAEKYDMRVDAAAKGVSVSTLACIATIPLVLLIIGV